MLDSFYGHCAALSRKIMPGIDYYIFNKRVDTFTTKADDKTMRMGSTRGEYIPS